MTTPPMIGLVMGSDSDWPVMQAAALILKEHGVPYEARVVSAHRTPDLLFEYAASARERGLRAIIAGAGGAAHLPGMLAAKTTIPVLGVPIPTRQLKGMDSLLSIVQMPGGIPVAAVAIGNAKNAGILAARILGTSDPELQQRLVDYAASLAETAHAKGDVVRQAARGSGSKVGF